MKFGQTSKKEETPNAEPLFKTAVLEEPADLNSTAFSITRNPEGGFALVEVKYNPITMQAKVSSVKRVADSREDAEYYFRVRVGEFFGEEATKS